METTIVAIITLVTISVGTTIATTAVILRSVGNFRRHMDRKFDALARSDREGYDMICRKLDDSMLAIRFDTELDRARLRNRPTLYATATIGHRREVYRR